MIQFGVLGPLSASRDGVEVPLGSGMPRRLVAILLSRAGHPVAVPELIDVIWGERPPSGARGSLQVYVHRLRQALGDDDLVRHRAGSYLLAVGENQVDALQFMAMARLGRDAIRRKELDEAERLFRGALRLWRGPAYADVDGVVAVAEEAARLEEQRMLVHEECTAIDLDLGRHASVVPDLVPLASAHPYRERLQGLLMQALYRSGRRADALAAYRRTRELLTTQLGVDPGTDLRRVHEAILRGEDDLAAADTGGAAAFSPAPISARTPTPRQLPAGVARFVGRAGEMRALDDMLERAVGAAPAVVISAIAGTAGVGKTALAVTWSHRVADRYPDGQLYVNLRGYAADQPVKPIEALAQFLRALDIPPDRVPAEAAEAAALYRSLLADRRVLILLDNAGSAEQVRPLLPGSNGCLVVVTSRDRLGGLVAREGAHRITLDVLSNADADALLTDVIGDRARNERDGVADLAKLCGYLPLALRVAAANLMNHPGRTIADYIAEFARGNRLAALTVEGDDEAAVRITFDLSYRVLPPAAQRLFRLVSLVPGPDFGPSAAAALLDTTTSEAGRLLDRLGGAHLIHNSSPGRFTFHDLLRSYARERADRDEPVTETRAATDRLYTWYVETAEAAANLLYPQILRVPVEPSPAVAGGAPTFASLAEGSAWLNAEAPNLVAASLRAVADPAQRSAAWRLLNACREYLGSCGNAMDWLAVARAGLAAARADGERRAEALASLTLARAHHTHGRFRVSLLHLTRAISLCRAANWAGGESVALNNLGNAHCERGLLDEGCRSYHRSLELAPNAPTTLTNLGLTNWYQGQLAEAAGRLELAVRGYQATGSPNCASALDNLARVRHSTGDLATASRHVARALVFARPSGFQNIEVSLLATQALVQCDAGRYDDALVHGHGAVELANRFGRRLNQARALNALAGAQLAVGRHHEAVASFRAGRRCADEVEARYYLAAATVGLSRAQHALGNHDQALDEAHKAVGLSERGGFLLLLGQALTQLAAIHLADNQQRHIAVTYAERALEIHRTTGHRLGEARALVILGRAQWELSDAATAQSRWRTAHDLFTTCGARPEAAATAAMASKRSRIAL